MIERFAQLTGDRSALHVDPHFAQRSPYGRNIVHGLLPVMFLSALQIGNVVQGRFGFRRIAASFRQPAYAGNALELSIGDLTSARADSSGELEFSISRRATREVLTTGVAVVAPADRLSCTDTKDVGTTIGLAVTPLIEQARSLEQVCRGDTVELTFVPGRSSLRTLFQILRTGAPSGMPEWERWCGACDGMNLLAASMVSTMVGMCLPGRNGILTNVDIEFATPLEFDRVYDCRSTVIFASAVTRMIVERIVFEDCDTGSIHGEGTAHVRINLSGGTSG